MSDAIPAPEARREVELTIVTMELRSTSAEKLMPILAKYIVVSRGHAGCRNIDLCVSVANPSKFVIIQKWDSIESQREHFDSPAMVEMAKACAGLLTSPPDIDLLEGISAHDLA